MFFSNSSFKFDLRQAKMPQRQSLLPFREIYAVIRIVKLLCKNIEEIPRKCRHCPMCQRWQTWQTSCHGGVDCVSPLPFSLVLTLFSLSAPSPSPCSGGDPSRHLHPSGSHGDLNTAAPSRLRQLMLGLSQAQSRPAPLQTCSWDGVPFPARGVTIRPASARSPVCCEVLSVPTHLLNPPLVSSSAS